MSVTAYQLDLEDLASLLPGEPAYRVDQLREWLYQHPVLDPSMMTNLPGEVRERLHDRLWPFITEIEQSADDGRTRKWLFRASDGASIEAVLMGYERRTTLCISSQAGCAMGCTFCATGQFGFERHLDAGEIVAQIAYANAAMQAQPLPASPNRVTNVVFMGMGEPLANYTRSTRVTAPHHRCDRHGGPIRNRLDGWGGPRYQAARRRAVAGWACHQPPRCGRRTPVIARAAQQSLPDQRVGQAASYYFEKTGRGYLSSGR